MRRNRADDAWCERMHAVAHALYFGTDCRQVRGPAAVGRWVVVIDGLRRGGHARDAMGDVIEYRDRAHRYPYVIRTPRGRLMRWGNCVLMEVRSKGA